MNDSKTQDMRFLGQTTEGVYNDPLDGIHPDAVNRYYGVARTRRHRQTGASHASDEDVSDEESDPDLDVNPQEQLENQIEEDQAPNIHHEPVKVAWHASPFEAAQHEADFLELLDVVLSRTDMLPNEYGVQEEEWDE